MSRKNQLKTSKQSLRNRYLRLIEKSNDYRFIDETKSDLAAYKALKVLGEINRFRYLDRELQSLP